MSIQLIACLIILSAALIFAGATFVAKKFRRKKMPIWLIATLGSLLAALIFAGAIFAIKSSIERKKAENTASETVSTDGEGFKNLSIEYEKAPYFGIGAMLGDHLGIEYEHNAPNVRENRSPRFSDDAVMTAAIMEALTQNYENLENLSSDQLETIFRRSFAKWFDKSGQVGYGGGFSKLCKEWLAGSTKRGKSWANGAVMRVSPIAWAATARGLSLDEALRITDAATVTSHDSEDSVASARMITTVLYMALRGENKETIRHCMEEKYGVDLSTMRNEKVYDPEHGYMVRNWVWSKNLTKDKYDALDQQQLDAMPVYFGAGSEMSVKAKDTACVALYLAFNSNNMEEIVEKARGFGGDVDTILATALPLSEAFDEFKKSQGHVEACLDEIEKDGSIKDPKLGGELIDAARTFAKSCMKSRGAKLAGSFERTQSTAPRSASVASSAHHDTHEGGKSRHSAHHKSLRR
jgi:ADP-ribosylglycohydrolase